MFLFMVRALITAGIAPWNVYARRLPDPKAEIAIGINDLSR